MRDSRPGDRLIEAGLTSKALVPRAEDRQSMGLVSRVSSALLRRTKESFAATLKGVKKFMLRRDTIVTDIEITTDGVKVKRGVRVTPETKVQLEEQAVAAGRLALEEKEREATEADLEQVIRLRLKGLPYRMIATTARSEGVRTLANSFADADEAGVDILDISMDPPLPVAAARAYEIPATEPLDVEILERDATDDGLE